MSGISESSVNRVPFGQGDATGYLQALRPYVDSISDEITEVSHQIHQNPELGFQETFAAQLLTEKLERHGFTTTRGIADLPTAFMSTATNTTEPGDHPTLAIFCEYDALEELGHGCGHNIIASAGLGAAIATKRWMEDHPGIPGRLVVFGSPAEEGGGGKAYLLQAGFLDDTDAAMMMHPRGENRAGRATLARIALDVSFTGKAAHAAARPHEGVNALDAANLSLTAVGLLRQQIHPDSRINAIMTEGGQAINIIPEHASLSMYVRSPDSEYLSQRLLPAVENCIRGAALATGATAEITRPTPAYEDMVDNEVLVQLSEANLRALGRQVESGPAEGGIGSTDMGNVSHAVPSTHPYIELVPGLAMHTRQAAEAAGAGAGNEVVIDGALELATTAAELYSQPELLASAKTVFEERER